MLFIDQEEYHRRSSTLTCHGRTLPMTMRCHIQARRFPRMPHQPRHTAAVLVAILTSTSQMVCLFIIFSGTSCSRHAAQIYLQNRRRSPVIRTATVAVPKTSVCPSSIFVVACLILLFPDSISSFPIHCSCITGRLLLLQQHQSVTINCQKTLRQIYVCTQDDYFACCLLLSW